MGYISLYTHMYAYAYNKSDRKSLFEGESLLNDEFWPLNGFVQPVVWILVTRACTHAFHSLLKTPLTDGGSNNQSSMCRCKIDLTLTAEINK